MLLKELAKIKISQIEKDSTAHLQLEIRKLQMSLTKSKSMFYDNILQRYIKYPIHYQ
jgi:hypothetical protein